MSLDTDWSHGLPPQHLTTHIHTMLNREGRQWLQTYSVKKRQALTVTGDRQVTGLRAVHRALTSLASLPTSPSRPRLHVSGLV